MNLNVVRRLSIEATQKGVAEATRGLEKLGQAHGGIAEVSEKSARATLSMERALEKHQRALDLNYRASKQFDAVQRDLDRARAQGLISVERHNSLMDLARQRVMAASAANDNFARGGRAAFQAMQGEAQALAGRLGTLGAALAAVGPGGLALAALGGAAVLGLHAAADAALKLADRAGKLKDFAETTGFTVIELQALEKAGAQVGVSSESVTKSLEKFSVEMAEVRLQTGSTYDKLLAINPALAQQVSTANSLSKAYELVARAIKGTDVERANEIARAFFGRGGVEQTRLMRAVADADGLKGLIAQLHQADIITAQQAERWDTFGDKIAENMKAAKQNIASIFAEDVLVSAERFSKAFLDLTREVKQFGINEDFKKFIDFFMSPTVQAAIAGALAGGLAAGPVGAVVGAGAGAVGGRMLELEEADKIKEVTAELERLNLARDQAINGVLKYQRMAAEPNNTFFKEDAEQAVEYGRVLDRVEQRISALTKKPLQITVNKPAEGFEELEDAGIRATKAALAHRDSVVAEFNAMSRWVSAIGSAVTISERYELGLKKLNAEKALNRVTEEQHGRAVAALQQQMEISLGVVDANVLTQQRLAQVREFAAKAGWDEEKTRLAVMIAQKDAAEQAQRIWARQNPIMANLREAAQGFTQNLVQGLVQGKSLMESLSAAAEQLSASMANAAIASLFKGDLLMAGIQAAIAIISSLFSRSQNEAKKAREREERLVATRRDADALEDRRRGTSGSVSSQLERDMFESQSIANRFWADKDSASARRVEQQAVEHFNAVKADFLAGWSGMMDEIGRGNSVFSEARANVSQFADQMKSFIKDTQFFTQGRTQQVVDAEKAAQGALLSMLQNPEEMSAVEKEMQRIAGTANALQKALVEVGMSAEDAAAAIAQGVTKALDRLRRSFLEDLQRQINDASGQSFLNDFSDLFKQIEQMRADAAALGVGGDLVEQLFGMRAQEIVEEFGLTGDAFQKLLEMFPELAGVIHEATGEINDQADAQRRLAEQTASAVRGIVDYINNLTAGPQSGLSPANRLAAAQGTYAATLGLARAGNVDALARITQDAENLRLALQGMFGSTGGYQSGLQQIIADLMGLPAVQGSQDPLVQAILAGNAVLAEIRAADQGTEDNTDAALSLLATVINGLNLTIGRLDTTIANLVSTIGLLGTANTLGSAGNVLLAQIQALNTTASAQLTLLNQQYQGSVVIQVPNAGSVGGGSTNVTVTNTMLRALNLIAINTWATAENTANIAFGDNNDSYVRRGSPPYASGGTVPPNAMAMFGEHHPQGPFFMRNGPMPFPITPNLPQSFAANDNRSVVVELRQFREALLQRVDRLERQFVDVTIRCARHVGDGVQEVVVGQRRASRETTLSQSSSTHSTTRNLSSAAMQSRRR